MKKIIDNLSCICYSGCNLILRKLREGVICTKECVICQHTGICGCCEQNEQYLFCTWQILMNETHVCSKTVYTELLRLYCFTAYVGLFVYSDTFLRKKEKGELNYVNVY